jgi:hypothetical protein
MLFYFPIFFSSLFYFLAVEAVAFNEEWAPFVVLALLFGTVRIVRGTAKSFLLAMPPALFVVSSLLLLYLIDSAVQRHFFAFVSASAYYLAILGGYRLRSAERDQTARGMLAFSSTMTLLFFYCAVYGFYLNFAVPLWLLMLAYCLGTFMVSYPYFWILDRERRPLALAYAAILSLSMAEIAWVINFWPFGYLTTGVVVLVFYYVLWDLTQSYFLNILSQRRVLVHIGCLGLLVGMILASSRWLPAV